MSFKPAVCSSCKKEIQVPDSPDPRCAYCGAIQEDRAASHSPSLANLLGLGGTALAAGNPKEAAEYYNRVLEVDPRNSEAWFGKGKAAGWQSTLTNIRIQEMLVAFNHAIATAPETARQQMISVAVEEANRVATAVYKMARKHLLQFAALQQSWIQYLEQMSQILDGLEHVSQWLPSHRVTLENIVHVCKENIEGVNYRGVRGDTGVWHLSPQYEILVRTKMDGASARLRALDPSYAPPEIKKRSPEGCFVVTAALGDFNHPTVTLLRRFRDERILKRWWGVSFVQVYYAWSPWLAQRIADRPMLRTFVLCTLIAPLVWVARFSLRRTRKTYSSSNTRLTNEANLGRISRDYPAQ